MGINVPIENDEHWHSLRAEHIGGSEIAALFDKGKFLGKWELFQVKSGNLPPEDISDKDIIIIGNRLEAPIADMVRDKTGWNIQKVRRYIKHDSVEGLGGTLDYEIIKHEDGAGVLEIKTAHPIAFKEWKDEEPPLQYELQLQLQLCITGRSWGALAVLVGNDTLKIYPRKRDERIIKAIEARVASFWEDVHNNNPPEVDYEKESDAVIRMYSQANSSDEVIDMSSDEKLDELVCDYILAKDNANQEEEKAEAIKAEILSIVQDSKAVKTETFKLNLGMVKDSQPTIVTQDMVGSSIGGRKGYRMFKVSALNKDK